MRAFAVACQLAGRFDKEETKCAIDRSEHLLSLAKMWGGTCRAFGEAGESEGVVAESREVAGRQGGGQCVARGRQQRIEVRGRETVGQLTKSFRRLIEPQAGDQFGGLRGMFEPRRLPGDFGDEIGFATQALGDVARGALSCLAVGGVNVENQLARVGKMMLVDFKPF